MQINWTAQYETKRKEWSVGISQEELEEIFTKAQRIRLAAGMPITTETQFVTYTATLEYN